MALQFVNVPEQDFSKGIDARSAENQIQEGFVRDLLNADVIERRVRKRTGYESYAGNMPVRATRLDYTAPNKISFTLDSVVSLNTSVSLEFVRSSPLVVYGRVSNSAGGSGPFTTTDSCHYYSKFSVPIRKELVAPDGVLSIPGTEHGLGTTDFFCNVVQSTDTLSKNYTDIDVDSITINSSTYDVNISYIIDNSIEDKQAIVYYKNESNDPGNNYIHTFTHDGDPVSQDILIERTDHNLINYNIIYQLYQLEGSDWVLADPDKLTIESTGDVTVTVSNDTGTTVTYKIILSACPTVNITNGEVGAATTISAIGTGVIESPTSPWIFYNIYLTDPDDLTGPKESVKADSVEYDQESNTIVFKFTNNSNEARDFTIFYQYGDIRSNVLTVEDESDPAIPVVSGTDLSPQITLWGLDHQEIYTDKSAREGWVNHIDTYRRSGEQRLIAGLGGNLFSAQTYSEAAVEYKYARLYPSLQSRTSQFLNIGPLFYDTGDEPKRTRGYITSDISGTGWVQTTAVEYEQNILPLIGTTKYTLSVPNMAFKDKDGNPLLDPYTMISTTSGLEDWLTVTNMSYKRHEGTFRIKQVTPGVEKLEIWVENPDNNSSDWDDGDVGGYAGVFTDQVSWLSGCSYIPEDILILNKEDLAPVVSSTLNITVCGSLTTVSQLAAGVLITGRRTSAVLPMRQALPSLADSVTNLVRGDMLSYTGIDRNLRVLNINADSDRSVSISGDGETATVTMLSGDTSFLSGQQKVILINAGNYSGVHTISNILSSAQFTFSTEHSDTESLAILSGKTVEIDESLEWSDTSGDSNAFQVPRRWIPVEAPDDSWTLTPSTHVRYFEADQYSNQSFIRSIMVADNLYLTNGKDEVMKFDGENIYRAGLPAWQPGLFVTQSVNPTSRTCTINNGSNILTTASTAGIEIGAVVSDGTAIPEGVVVTAILSTTQFTISSPAVGNATTTVSFTIPRIVVNLKKIQYKGTTDTKLLDAGTLELTQKYETSVLPIGSKVRISGSTKTYTIKGYETDTNHIIFENKFEGGEITTATDGVISEVGTYKYYFRLNAVDANDNLIVSAMTSSDDMSIELSENAAVHLKLVGFPAFDNYDYDRLELQIYRTQILLGTTRPVFYLITTIPLDFNSTTGYVEYTDTFSDKDLYELDRISAITGPELGIGWSDPLRAKYMTTTSNRLILGNIKDYPELDMQIVGPANLSNSQIAGGSLLFRRNASDTASDTNMVDRIKFEWKIADSTKSVNSFTIGTNQFSFTASGISGVSEGDWIYLYYSSVAFTSRLLKYAGWWQVKSVVGTVVTVNLTGATASTSYPDKYIVATDPSNVPVLLDKVNAKGTIEIRDGNLGQVNGDTFDIFDATRRLSLALNAVMRQVDTSLLGMSDFRPWLSSRSGNDLASAGRIVVRSTEAVDIFPSVVPDFSNYSMFVNSIRVSSGENVQASQKLFPSRILVSYENAPELFDSPTVLDPRDSVSVIDINPADGQEITGVIPFFGEAAFTAAQQAGILVVFKTNSIYLVDINQKVSGGSLIVQRLETQGLGCTAPYSIAVTKNGIMFANNSGIYSLGRDQTIRYIGKYMERNWVGKVDQTALELAQGHHYGVGRMYKLSVPLLSSRSDTGYMEPTEVYVYNHTQEDPGSLGAWSRYDNHTAIGWANLASDAFWASTRGNVYALRSTGSETDYRDSNEAIVFRLDTRPNSYGNSGIRKILDKVTASYRANSASTSNSLLYSVDLENEYSETTPFKVKGNSEDLNGIDDIIGKDIITIRHSLTRSRGVYFSIRIENSGLDQNVEIAGLDYWVGALDNKGILSAAKT